jgi:hypothetical protein
MLFRIIWKLFIYDLNFNFCNNGGFPSGEINRDVIFTNKNADILMIVTEKFSKMNYGIANRTEYIVDEEILDIKKMLRVRI